MLLGVEVQKFSGDLPPDRLLKVRIFADPTDLGKICLFLQINTIFSWAQSFIQGTIYAVSSFYGKNFPKNDICGNNR
ncbi:hypothetical protein OKW43_003607 [Paraburkholderia sp. WC7.3g]